MIYPFTNQQYSIWTVSVLFIFLRDSSTDARVTFSEKFLETRAGRYVNVSFLMDEYSKICPMRETCGVKFQQYLLPDGLLEEDFPDCPFCSCEPSCVSFANCCPGTHFGYIHHDCMNTQKFPDNSEFKRYLVNKCIEGYTNETVIDKCENEFHPCITAGSMVAYSSKYCAECNKENSCIDWKLNVICETISSFEELMSTVGSTEEFKLLLSNYHCRVRFESPDNAPPINDRSCPNLQYLDRMNVDKCNVTGLWKEYNADIVWACKNFIIPFKEFKNVFCYICNPSRGTEQDNTDDFNPATSEDELELEICHACKTFPQSKRLSPVKNIYCLKCREHQDQILLTEDGMQLNDISETIESALFSTISIKLSFTGELSEETFLRFVDENFKKAFPVVTDRVPEKRIVIGHQNIKNVTKEYTAVCGVGNTCSETFPGNKSELKYSFGNRVCGTCSCKVSCIENLNCCSDLIFRTQPYSCIHEHNFLRIEKPGNVMESLLMSKNYSYTIIDRCLREDDDTYLECSGKDLDSDILYTIPIGSGADVTYKNLFCYKCVKQETLSDLRIEFQVTCPTYIEYKLFLSVNALFKVIRTYCSMVSFIPRKSLTCGNAYDIKRAKYVEGLKYERTNDSRELYTSDGVALKANASESEKYPKEVFVQCNQTGLLSQTDILIKDICENDSNSMLYLPEYRPYKRVYKNFACFLCNPDENQLDRSRKGVIDGCQSDMLSVWYPGETNLEYLCNTTEEHIRWFPYKNLYCSECNQPSWQMVMVSVYTSDWMPAVPLKYIFTLSPEDFEHLDYIEVVETFPDCPGGTYDRTAKLCRSLFCNPRYQLSNGTCSIPIIKSASYIKYKVELSLHRNFILTTNTSDVLSKALKHFGEICDTIIEVITNGFSADTDFLIVEKYCETSEACLSLNGTAGSVRGNYIDMNDIEEIKSRFEIIILFTDNILSVEYALVQALSRNFIIKAVKGEVNTTAAFESRPSNIPGNNGQNVPLFLPCITAERYADSSSYPRLHDSRFTYPYIVVDRFLICPYIKLDVDEVCVSLSSSDISLKGRNVTFTEEEYKIEKGYYKVCAEVYRNKTYRAPLKKQISYTPVVKNVLIIFSLSCTVLSLVCLMFTFLAYCLLAHLRTVPGKNVMVLCVYLFFSQALLQFGINQDNGEIPCVVIGYCIHFFVMGSFCVMNVCSFHTLQVFWCNAISGRDFSRNLFVKYLVYEIVVPFLFVTATTSISLINSNGQDFGYGKFYCFISDFYLFLFTFVLPVSLIFISNVIFFSLAFHKIRTSPKMNKKSTRQTNNFFICLKLFALIGITWPLMIVDNLTDTTWFSFVVSGLNSLQGVFILFSFVINKNVLSMILSTLLEKLGSGNITTAATGSSIESQRKTNSTSQSK